MDESECSNNIRMFSVQHKFLVYRILQYKKRKFIQRNFTKGFPVETFAMSFVLIAETIKRSKIIFWNDILQIIYCDCSSSMTINHFKDWIVRTIPHSLSRLQWVIRTYV